MKCPINIAGMVNILHKIFKYTIVTCNLNSYQTFLLHTLNVYKIPAKEHQVVHS